MDVAFRELRGRVGGDGLGLGDLLGLEAFAFKHVLEVHVAADVELVGAVQDDAAVFEQFGHDAVRDGCADLRLDVVTDDGHAGFAELLGPFGGSGDEHWECVDERDAGVDRALSVELVRFFGADRQVGDEDVDVGFLEGRDNVDWLCRGFLDGLAVVLAEAVEGVAALNGHAGFWHVAQFDGVVFGGFNRVSEVEADFLCVDIECRNELHIVDVVVAELHVHQTWDGLVCGGVFVVFNALHERGRTIADAHDSDADCVIRHGNRLLGNSE